MTVEEKLLAWGDNLFNELAVESLLERNPTAHKWKATFRSLVLRETLLWRAHDLLSQSLVLHQSAHALGARILLRSAFETLGALIYLNQLTEQVLEGTIDFHEFGKKTVRLLLGSKNKSTDIESINIITILGKCDQKYPGLQSLYGDLSESAHPSYEGMSAGYSKNDAEEYTTTFFNRWQEKYGQTHLEMLDLCIDVFQHEYNDVWIELFEKLETWIADNDEKLEATKPVVE